jgi:hypothetical protein
MSKFVAVKKAPANVGKGEYVIAQPNFMEHIKANAHKAAKSKRTGINHLRDIINDIQQKYQVDLNLFKIPLTQYEGIQYSTDEELNTFIVGLLKKERPALFEKVLEYNIKNRPYGTKLIYYVGDWGDTGPFFKEGVDSIEEKDVDDYLSGKPKKIVGKPALTKEETEERAKQ